MATDGRVLYKKGHRAEIKVLHSLIGSHKFSDGQVIFMTTVKKKKKRLQFQFGKNASSVPKGAAFEREHLSPSSTYAYSFIFRTISEYPGNIWTPDEGNIDTK